MPGRLSGLICNFALASCSEISRSWLTLSSIPKSCMRPPNRGSPPIVRLLFSCFVNSFYRAPNWRNFRRYFYIPGPMIHRFTCVAPSRQPAITAPPTPANQLAITGAPLNGFAAFTIALGFNLNVRAQPRQLAHMHEPANSKSVRDNANARRHRHHTIICAAHPVGNPSTAASSHHRLQTTAPAHRQRRPRRSTLHRVAHFVQYCMHVIRRAEQRHLAIRRRPPSAYVAASIRSGITSCSAPCNSFTPRNLIVGLPAR